MEVTARFRALAPLDAAALRAREARGKTSVFEAEAGDLLGNLAEMETLVRKVRPKYLRPKTFIRTKGAKMSEQEKDEFDADLVELVKNCSSKIDALKAVTDAQPVQSMQVEHQKEVVTYLLERLKEIADGAKRMQKRRYQQPFLLSSRLLPEDKREELEALEQKVARMKQEEAKKKRKKEEAAAGSAILDTPVPPVTGTDTDSSLPATVVSAAASLASPKAEMRPHDAPKRQKSKPKPKPKPAFQSAPVFASQNEELEFTEEDSRRFKVENVMLHRHFQENLEDAKNMESKMAEISNLMGQFADKIMEQQSDIELIQQHAQETKANVTQSNRILEHTQKIGNGYGFMIFCFYAGFSVILHMLHYFNS